MLAFNYQIILMIICLISGDDRFTPCRSFRFRHTRRRRLEKCSLETSRLFFLARNYPCTIGLKTRDTVLRLRVLTSGVALGGERNLEYVSVCSYWRCLTKASAAKVVCGPDNQLPCDHGLFYRSENKDHQLLRRWKVRIGSPAHWRRNFVSQLLLCLPRNKAYSWGRDRLESVTMRTLRRIFVTFTLSLFSFHFLCF